MKLKYTFVVAAAVLVFAAASVNAQTVRIAMLGSSGIWQALGESSASQNGCYWTAPASDFTATDKRFTPNLTDSGAAWVTWTTGATGTCAAPSSDAIVDFDMNTDSTVGNRCFFGAPASGASGCLMSTTATGGLAGANTFPAPFNNDTAIPASVVAAINVATDNIDAAATDVRPEDAKFATIRGLSPCGQVVSGQYLGIGYQTTTTGLGVAIQGSLLNHANPAAKSFNVADFNLIGTDPVTGGAVRSFTVIPVGAVPIVVFVNPASSTGFGSLLATNITRGELAGYYDGTLGKVTDLVSQPFVSGAAGSYVFVREFLSGTYNTFEYAIPNSQSNQSSQDVGLAALNQFNSGSTTKGPLLECGTGASGGVTRGTDATATVLSTQNPLQDNPRGSTATGGRFRSIGTGNMVAAVLAQSNGLGYAFWSSGNFKNALPTNAKYLTVDGIDPIQETWIDGLIPTAGNGLLGDVSFAHVKDGSYPIWSLLRTECDPNVTGVCTAVTGLATAAQELISPFIPDFVANSQLLVFHAHFAPPGVNFNTGNVPANGHGTSVEAGGDVAGVVYSLQADGDYISDTTQQGGIVGRRN
jgi:hypothetical protein